MAFIRSPTSFHAVYESQAASSPGVTAVVCRGAQRQTLSYGAVYDRAKVLVAGLQQWIELNGETVFASVEPGTSTEKSVGDFPISAVHLARTNPDFVPLLVALSHVSLPFVLLSTDLADKKLEEDRNKFIFRTLSPHVCITSDMAQCLCSLPDAKLSTAPAVLTIDNLVSLAEHAGASLALTQSSLLPTSSLLCFMLTGGSLRTKVVQVTHAMIVHERTAYHELWQPRTGRPIVLCHTSVYWGASALGQLSIALAYGGTAVWSEAIEVADLLQCIKEEGVTVLGLVPDHLDLLAPEAPQRELPSVECVFTWGERLPHSLAARWRSHKSAVIWELLIATEYWLTLYANPLGDGTLRAVRSAELLIMGENGNAVEDGELGELCIAGPMVTAGYLSVNGHSSTSDAFVFIEGRRYYRTRDLVQRVSGGIVYKGRADMMAKQKGKWVDMLAVEDALQRLSGVHGAKVIPDPSSEHFHAFVSLAGGCSPGVVIPTVREVLPLHVQLWVLPELPRHPVTRKVDSARLLRSLPKHSMSWPYECAPQSVDSIEAEKMTMLHERLRHKVHWQYAWVMASLSTLVAAVDFENYPAQLTFATIWLSSVLLSNEYTEQYRATKSSFVCSATWLFAAVAWNPGLAKLLRAAAASVGLSYMWLTVVYADDIRKNSDLMKIRDPSSVSFRVSKFLAELVEGIPLMKIGTFAVLTCAGYCLPFGLGTLCHLYLFSLIAFGAAWAWSRNRLLPWPVVFWCVGLGAQLEIECSAWLRVAVWYQEFFRLLRLPLTIVKWVFGKQPPPVQEFWCTQPQPVASAQAAKGDDDVRVEFSCSSCRRCTEGNAWPAFCADGQRLCDPCGARAIGEEEREVSAWLDRLIGKPGDGSIAEPPAKRPRQESGDCNGKNGDANIFDHAWPIYMTHNPEMNKEDNGYAYRRFERWWWNTQAEEYFELTDADRQRAIQAFGGERTEKSIIHSSAEATQDEIDAPDEARRLCRIIGEVAKHLAPVNLSTALIGLDSLCVARLAYVVKAQLGRTVTGAQLRGTSTVAALWEIVQKTEDVRKLGLKDVSDLDREFAIWFSPGQYSPMGAWVWQSDDYVDRDALRIAIKQLIERHSAMRTEIIDPLHYMGILYNSAVMWSLYAPVLKMWSFPFRCLVRLVCWSLQRTWPTVRCRTREQIYGASFPDDSCPVRFIRIKKGQTQFEKELKYLTNNARPPLAVTVYQLECHLVDIWMAPIKKCDARFAILRRPDLNTEGTGLVYVDVRSGEWGPLLTPCNSRWRTPPYRFPAVLFVPLNSGGLVWIRYEKVDELRIVYKSSSSRSAQRKHFAAFRSAPRRSSEWKPEWNDDKLVISFMSVTMFHSFSDGNSYMPLAQDLFSLYDAARSGEPAVLPPVMEPLPFESLERRLFDALQCRSVPTRSSLRGGVFRYYGKSYTHQFGLERDMIEVLSRAAAHHRVALDVFFLGLIVCGIAHADKTEKVELTLYAPMRDGVSETTMIGLFSDWRDISFGVDLDLATVLGTMLQVDFAIQHRKWTPFNALRKPERTIVNMQPVDMEHRSHFQHIAENLWKVGDKLDEGAPQRLLDQGRQPLTINIEQQDKTTWWILIDVGYNERPPSWTRTFSAALRRTIHDFVFDPQARVHRPFPEEMQF